MNKTDISTQFFYIKKAMNVLASTMKRSKAWTVDGRHSDALIFVTEGICSYRFLEDGYGFTVQKGDVLYLANNAVYRMELQTEQYSVIYIDFDFDATTPTASRVYRPKNAEETERLFKQLLRMNNSAHECLAERLSVLYRIYGSILQIGQSEYVSPSTREQIDAIKQYIDVYFSDAELSVPALAARAQMSEAYLRRLFRAQYGIAPAQYVTQTRLAHAKRLLLYPFLSLEDVAHQCGFLNATYFCRVFKSRHGLTPSQYRRNHAKP